MVKSSEVLKDLSKWSYNGSIKGKEGHFNLVFWGEGENNNKVIEPEEKWEKYEEIAKGFFKEIKQNPQDWQLKEAPNSDPYFDCYLIEHKSGRKHYTPKHRIWGFGDLWEEWNEVLSVLKGEKKDEPQDNPSTNPLLPQKQPFYQSKTFWFLVVGVVVVSVSILFAIVYIKEKTKTR